MKKTLKLLIRVIAGSVALSMLLVIFVGGYIGFNLLIYQEILIPFVIMDADEIVKKAVSSLSLRGKNYIVCKRARATGFNYELIKDESGKWKDEYVLVSGIDVEGILSHDFIIAGNSFVFYVVERIDHIPDPNDEYGEYYTEYIVDGWDVLYPVKHGALINTAPRYVLKSDYFRSEDP